MKMKKDKVRQMRKENVVQGRKKQRRNEKSVENKKRKKDTTKGKNATFHNI